VKRCTEIPFHQRFDFSLIAGDTLAASQGGNRVAPFVDRVVDRAGYAETRASSNFSLSIAITVNRRESARRGPIFKSANFSTAKVEGSTHSMYSSLGRFCNLVLNLRSRAPQRNVGRAGQPPQQAAARRMSRSNARCFRRIRLLTSRQPRRFSSREQRARHGECVDRHVEHRARYEDNATGTRAFFARANSRKFDF